MENRKIDSRTLFGNARTDDNDSFEIHLSNSNPSSWTFSSQICVSQCVKLSNKTNLTKSKCLLVAWMRARSRTMSNEMLFVCVCRTKQRKKKQKEIDVHIARYIVQKITLNRHHSTQIYRQTEKPIIIRFNFDFVVISPPLKNKQFWFCAR